ILQLLTLRDRYGNVNGHEVLRKFDLVIANSGGSIVLAALAENWTLEQALSLFRDRETRERIFSKNSFRDRFFPVDYLRLFGISIGPKYSSKRKMEALAGLFKKVHKRQMAELPAFIGKESLKLVVCTYDALNNNAKFFRSYHNDTDDFDAIKLTQAVHGSSNAPVQYFDFPARFKDKKSNIYYELWDGALGGFNNPVLAGIIEAYKLRVKISEVQVVSLGTGNKLMSMKDKKDFWDLKLAAQRNRRKKFAFSKFKYQLRFFTATVLNQAKTILYEPPDWSNYVAIMFLDAIGQRNSEEQLIRLSPLIHLDAHTPKATRELIKILYKLDMDLTTDAEIDQLMACFEAWKAGTILNQPVEFKVNRDNSLVFKNGNKYYKSAMERWESWEKEEDKR
ncbi:MAG: patatin-like phospholipase family protein, partial [Sinomicrobium sp.]|nr:patatin-like phospholipase family protein [Sinomicrobium sp.]